MDVTQPDDFLGNEATISQRWVSLRLNIQAFYERDAKTQENKRTGRSGDILWTSKHFTVPSEESLQDDELLGSILDWYRKQIPLSGAIVWYLHHMPPINLGARLYARGVWPNWEPHWMWCELDQLQQRDNGGRLFEIRIAPSDDHSPEGDELSSFTVCRVWKVTAFRKNVGLGSCMLNITTGEFGISGLFNLWVATEERNQGIEEALVQATCELACKIGCHHVVVNATDEGERVYRRVGFQSIGRGPSWFLNKYVLAQSLPTHEQVQFLEAVGKGDLKALDRMADRLTHDQLQRETINQLTPLEIAVRCKQSVSAEWLINHGVIPDIMSLWDLGWRDRIPALIAEHPELVKRKAGRWTATPLHTAIERNDIEMAKILLTVPNDLESKDGVFQGTPLGWARHFQRKDMIELLEL